MKKTLTLILIVAIYHQIQAQDILAKKILSPSNIPTFKMAKFLHSKSTVADYITERSVVLVNDTMLLMKEQTYTQGEKYKPSPEIYSVSINNLNFDEISFKRNKYALTTEENKSYNSKDHKGFYFEIFIYTKNRQRSVTNRNYLDREYVSLYFHTYNEANAVLEYLQKKADKNYEKKLTTAMNFIEKNFKTAGAKSLSSFRMSAKDDFSPANIPTTSSSVYSINNNFINAEEKTITIKNVIKEKRTQKVELNKLDLETYSILFVDTLYINQANYNNKKKTKIYLLAINCKEPLPYCIETTVSFSSSPGEPNSSDALYLRFASAIEAKAARQFIIKQLSK